MKLLVPYVIDDVYRAATTTIHVIFCASILYGGYQIFFLHIGPLRQTHLVALFTPACAAINSILSIFWILGYGILGAAWALVVYGLVLFIVVLTGCNRAQLRWPARWRTT